MNFLEAHRLVSSFAGGKPLSFLLAASGGAEKLDIFVRAAGAIQQRSIAMRTLPFNTLAQATMTEPDSGDREVFVLFPWDLVPEADWRSGFTRGAPDLGLLQSRARSTFERISARPNAKIIYASAPFPPVFPSTADHSRLAGFLEAAAASAGASMLDANVFSLASYLANGNPFSSQVLWAVAELIVSLLVSTTSEPRKVLITDLDNVMWRGIIGEDGVEGIQYANEGAGFRHFIYQTFLAKLKREGTLIAAVTRNDRELALAPFLSGNMSLPLDDLVAVIASYNAKSSQIREIAKQLNLGLDSFVFVDDNPIEIEEVTAAIPELRAILFPATDDALPGFFEEVASLFSRSALSAEDAERTIMYRRRLEGIVPTDAQGADITEFLRGLEMSLTIHDRSQGDRTRAVQLINKTNQFNLNGRRVSDEDVAGVLASGGRLFTVALSDRTGSHGEILSCLIDAEGVIRCLVMSCRVFQRRVEYAFMAWLGMQDTPPHALEFVSTDRNLPVRQFLGDRTFVNAEGQMYRVNWKEFTESHSSDLRLFEISRSTGARA